MSAAATTTTTPAAGAAGIARLAAVTPPERDRFMDFLRAASIAVVVLGHWLMAVVYWDGARLSSDNALASLPGAAVLTWVLQVMPVFFFVGGYSNFASLRSARRAGRSTPEWLRSRLDRLLPPTIAFIAVWTAAGIALDAAFGSGAAAGVAGLVAGPLWFIGVYLVVVGLAPAMAALHRRHGVRVCVVLAAGVVVVDAARLGLGASALGHLNFVFVWLLVHQLGFLYADGTLLGAARATLRLLAAAGLGGLVAATALGPYPTSMVGLPGEHMSNMNPPSVCIALLALWQIAAALLVRDRVGRWLRRPLPWIAVVAVNARIMTVYLWHLTALAGAIVVLYPIGWPQVDPATAMWWLTRPLWIAALAAAMVPLAAAFGRFERSPLETRSGA